MPLWLVVVASVSLITAAGVVAGLLLRALFEQARWRRSLDVTMLQVLLPKDIEPEEREEGVGEEIKERIAVGEQWLSTLSNLPTRRWDRWLYGRPVVVLEMVARPDDVIVFYAGTERRYLDVLEKQIYALYPDADVRPAPEYTIFAPGDTTRVATMRLRSASHVPIATYQELEADPMQALTGALAKIRGGDAAVIQFVCQAAGERVRRRGMQAARRTMVGRQRDVRHRGFLKPTGETVLRTAEQIEKSRAEAGKLTPRAQERVELVEKKLAQQQFTVTVRIGVSVRQREDAERVLNGIVAAFAQYDVPDLNSWRAVAPRDPKRLVRELVFRVPRIRGSCVLSTAELTSLYHFPLPTTATPNILWRGAKVAPAPAQLPTAGITIGTNVYRGIDTPVHFPTADRRRHLYMIGQTGTGKTTLFLNMVVQDIASGEGVAVVDPHGDLIEDILLHIPPAREADVILFDPRDTERPLGFNILEAADPAQKDLVINEVVQILEKLAARLNPESIGPMFEHYLRNALLALAEDPRATLVDVPRMFVDESFRRAVLARNPDVTVRQFWEKEFAQSQRGQLSADMLSYVISKLGRFISNAVVRNLIGQAHSSFDVRAVMDEGKILLCNLSKGHLGDINADLLGFVLVSKIQVAALARANVPESERRDFYLYLDEFQNFTTDSIVTILSEARKYRLNLNLTHQFIQQLDDKIREAVFGNVGTIICYRIGPDDAEFVAKQLAPVFAEYDVLNLDQFAAAVRLLVNNTPQRPFSLAASPPPAGGDPHVRERIRAASRERYGRPRAAVEAEVLARFQFGTGATRDEPKPSGEYLGESLFDVT